MSDSIENHSRIFNNVHLLFDIKCPDCLFQKQISFLLREYFNLEDGLNNTNECKYMCEGCNVEIFIGLRKIFSAEQIR